MDLYVMRHGDAVDPNDPGVTSDATRMLTDKGRDEVALMARLLERLGVRPALVLTSPYVRARQTAEIIAGVVGPASGPVESEELAFGGSAAVGDVLSRDRSSPTILVGHMPGVGRLVGYLAWGRPDLVVSFETAEVCRIDLPSHASLSGAGDLRWLIPPGVARKLLQSP